MKIKKEFVILAVVVVGLVAYLAFRKTDRTQEQLPALGQLIRKEISKIEITQPKSTIVLKKTDEKWTIDPQGFPADKQKVTDMIAALSDLSVTALVSESKNYARYELDANQRISVKAWSGTTLGRDLTIGKTATTFRHTHVKLPDDPNVYHAQGNFKRKFDLDVDALRDKTVLSFEPAEITEIHVRSESKTVSLVKKKIPADAVEKDPPTQESKPSEKTSVAWQTDDGKAVDATKVNQLLSRLSNLQCQSYVKDGKKGDYQIPVYQITLKGAKTFTLSLFDKLNKDATDQPATSSENAYPFLLADYQIDGFKKIGQEILNPKISK